MDTLEPQFHPSGPNNHPFQLNGSSFRRCKVSHYHPYARSQSPSAIISSHNSNNKRYDMRPQEYDTQSTPSQRMTSRRSSIIHVTADSTGTSIVIVDEIQYSNETRPQQERTVQIQNHHSAVTKKPVTPTVESTTPLKKKKKSTGKDSSNSQAKLKFHLVQGKESTHKFKRGTWTTEEHESFLKGYERYGNDWKRISQEFVPTRTKTQLASHAQKYFQRAAYLKQLGKEEKQDLLGKSRSLFFLDSHIQ